MKTRNSRAVLRKRAGLTQHRLSKITGIPSATISLWENDELDLGVKEVERIARAIAEEMNHAPAISTPEDLVRMLAPTNRRASWGDPAAAAPQSKPASNSNN